MARQWKEFAGRRAMTDIKAPRVTLQRDGGLGINKAAFELIGAPERIVYLFDPETNTFGMKAAQADTTNSYPVRPQANGASFVVSARLFFAWAKVPLGKMRYYTPKVEDGVLIVELDNPIGIVSNEEAR